MAYLTIPGWSRIGIIGLYPMPVSDPVAFDLFAVLVLPFALTSDRASGEHIEHRGREGRGRHEPGHPS